MTSMGTVEEKWGREGGKISVVTNRPPHASCMLAGHRQLLALLLFIPDLNAPFIFPPFKTWPGPRHCCRKHGPRDLSDGALTPAP